MKEWNIDSIQGMTEKELKRMQRKYKLVQIKDGFWKEVV